MIDGKSFLDVPVKNKKEAYKKVIKMSRNNDYTIGNLLNYEYFSTHYKLIATDLSIQIELENPDLKQQINFIGNLKEDKAEDKTENIKSSLCDYSDAFILVTGDITVSADDDTDVPFKNCAPFSTCKTEINDVFINDANQIYIALPMYNFIEYSDNYSDTSGSLWQFERDEPPANNADFTATNSESFKYKAALVGKTTDHTGTAADNNLCSFVKNTKIVVPLKYLSNFWRSLEILLINCKIHLELHWIEDCIYLVLEMLQNSR